MTIELLYLRNCPHYRETSDLVREVLQDEKIVAELTETLVSDFTDATERSFPGSPTVRVNGQDIEETPSNPLAVGFACRTYLMDGTARGVPPRAWLKRAVRAAYANEETRP
jgi:hypothetical protein